MNVWIEVSSDYRFDKKLAGEIGLVAPASSRYINMMKDVKQDDIILHYIIKQRAKKEHESRIIALSMAKSGMYINTPRIAVDLNELIMLPIPITLKEIKALKKQSTNLKKLIRMSFLRYLQEITLEDFNNLLKIHTENTHFLSKLEP